MYLRKDFDTSQTQFTHQPYTLSVKIFSSPDYKSDILCTFFYTTSFLRDNSRHIPNYGCANRKWAPLKSPVHFEKLLASERPTCVFVSVCTVHSKKIFTHFNNKSAEENKQAKYISWISTFLCTAIIRLRFLRQLLPTRHIIIEYENKFLWSSSK
jgi:hypothetical protein